MKFKFGIAGNLIALLVGIIIIVAVLIPTTISTVSAVNWTGYENAESIAQLLPLLLAVGGLVFIVYSILGTQ